MHVLALTHARLRQARDLLARNYDNALSSLEAVKQDMLSLRDNITTTEVRGALAAPWRCDTTHGAPPRPQVCIARVYNYDVSKRRGGKKDADA